MKKLLGIIVLGLLLSGNAYAATKYTYLSCKAIIKKNNSKDAAFFSKVQLAQIVENANSIKESGASSDEEKKAIYRVGYTNIKEKLTKRFGNKLAQELLKAANEARKQ